MKGMSRNFLGAASFLGTFDLYFAAVPTGHKGVPGKDLAVVTEF